MKTRINTIFAMLSITIIAGCGGSGTSNPASSQGTATTSISGKVADGYLVKATVFLDKNNNYQLDSGEPTTTTDITGAYTLMNVDPADVGKYPIVAMAIKDVTIDKDNNQTVPNSYLLSMPAAAISGTVSSNFISPMSSQLREMMETGTYATMQDAMNNLREKLGMPGVDMLTDYMAANNTSMHAAAQNMASLMGSQMPQIMGTNGSANTVDVNRYRGMMGKIFSNMSSVKGPNAQSGMSNLMSTMTVDLSSIAPGQPFHNMSTAFRGGVMAGSKNMAGGMMR